MKAITTSGSNKHHLKLSIQGLASSKTLTVKHGDIKFTLTTIYIRTTTTTLKAITAGSNKHHLKLSSQGLASSKTLTVKHGDIKFTLTTIYIRTTTMKATSTSDSNKHCLKLSSQGLASSKTLMVKPGDTNLTLTTIHITTTIMMTSLIATWYIKTVQTEIANLHCWTGSPWDHPDKPTPLSLLAIVSGQ